MTKTSTMKRTLVMIRAVSDSRADILDPHDDEISGLYHKLADIFLQQENYFEAASSYQKIIEIDPDDVDAKKKLDDIFSRLNLHSKAMNYQP